MLTHGPLKLFFNFYFNADPDPALHSNADPDPAPKNNADPCGLDTSIFFYISPFRRQRAANTSFSSPLG